MKPVDTTSKAMVVRLASSGTLSKSEVAKLSGVSRPTVAKILRDQKKSSGK